MSPAGATTIYGDLDVEVELNAPIGADSWFATGGTADFSLAHSWWRKMSVDGVHWGTAVNLLKAWAIIEQVRSRAAQASRE